MASKVHIEVGGQPFKIPRDLLENGPPSRLQEMYRSASTSNKHCVISVERPPEMFSAILAMYQTGELHIPMTSCPGAFINELAFWEIPVESLSSCCYNRYVINLLYYICTYICEVKSFNNKIMLNIHFINVYMRYVRQ